MNIEELGWNDRAVAKSLAREDCPIWTMFDSQFVYDWAVQFFDDGWGLYAPEDYIHWPGHIKTRWVEEIWTPLVRGYVLADFPEYARRALRETVDWCNVADHVWDWFNESKLPMYPAEELR